MLDTVERAAYTDLYKGLVSRRAASKGDHSNELIK